MIKSIKMAQESLKHTLPPLAQNLVKRQRGSHRRPPKTTTDPTTPIGILISHEIPEILSKHQQLIKDNFNVSEEPDMKMIQNPMKDIVNDISIKFAFNDRILKNVEILKLSSNGHGIAIIPSPTMEDVIQSQKDTTERQLAMGMTQGQEFVDGKKQKINRAKNIHRRDITNMVLPKFQIALIPFALPGDIISMKINMTNDLFVDGEIVSIEKHSEMRLKEDPKCAYFGVCSGCQYQSISYEDQLIQKMGVIEGAFEFFCKEIKNEWLGKILPTQGSPLQYRYRTKLTPHYDVPRSVSKKGFVDLDVIPRLGFSLKGKGEYLGLKFKKYQHDDEENNKKPIDYSEVPRLLTDDMTELPDSHPIEGREVVRQRSIRPYPGDVIDIEDCLIGTDIVRKGFLNEHMRLNKDWVDVNKRSKKGVTILLREHSTEAETSELGSLNPNTNELTKIVENGLTKTCVTNPQNIISDYVDTGLGTKLRFDFIANEFFQNNNSILPLVIKYVYDELFLGTDNKYLVDAYCGSGLFAVSIASSNVGVERVLGVEISERATEFAIKNAQLNNIPKEKCDFICGKAERLFESIDFAKDQTGVILDPPRKGCDDVFLNQLSDFEPKRIVYVSCNVHSQARDVDFFLRKTSNGSKYKLKSVKGFDFFPQTHHVESVAVLVRED